MTESCFLSRFAYALAWWTLIFANALFAPPVRGSEASELVVFNEAISQESAERLLQEIRLRKPSKLRFSSSGGSEYWAFRIADVIRRDKLKVEIFGTCLSACAQIILPASLKARVSDNAIIGLHHSSYAIHNWSLEAEGGNPRFSLIRAKSEELYGLYQRSFSRELLQLLDTAFQAVEPRCIDWPDDAAPSDFAIIFEKAFYFPLKGELVTAGIAPPETWPTNTSEAISHLEARGWSPSLFSFAKRPSQSSRNELEFCA